MKPTISIALITLGLTFPAPAMAVDYVQCEAMKRRFYADTQEQKERAEQADGLLEADCSTGQTSHG